MKGKAARMVQLVANAQGKIDVTMEDANEGEQIETGFNCVIYKTA